MKINPTHWNVAQTENLYKNFNQKYEGESNLEPQLTAHDQKVLKTYENPVEHSPSILSDNEIDILKLLFGENQKKDEFHFYGAKKPKSVHSGYFLDVKG